MRLLRAGGGRARLLARDPGGVNGDGELVSPSQSASAVWLTRTGNRAASDFLRVDLRSGRLTAVAPNLLLAGRVSRDERGTFWYLERPVPLDDSDAVHGFPPFCDVSPQPCRLVRASASPFSRRQRTLPPQLQVARSYINALWADPFTIAGRLTAPVVRGGSVLREQPLAGQTIELARITGSHGTVAATGLTAMTDATGRWSFTRAQEPPAISYVALDRALRLASRGIGIDTAAKVTAAANARLLSGTVTPAQPGRRVEIQRLKTHAAGNPPGCDPDGARPAACTEDTWSTIAQAPLDAAGNQFTATVDRPGLYRAVLPGGPPAYAGRSPAIQIT